MVCTATAVPDCEMPLPTAMPRSVALAVIGTTPRLTHEGENVDGNPVVLAFCATA